VKIGERKSPRLRQGYGGQGAGRPGAIEGKEGTAATSRLSRVISLCLIGAFLLFFALGVER